MKTLIVILLSAFYFSSCSTTKAVLKPGNEPLLSSQLFDLLMTHQLYLWDKDSVSWHQPRKVFVRNTTQPLYFALFGVDGIKRRNDPKYSDSLLLAFNPKPIQIIENVEQEFTEFIPEENFTSKKLLIETTGRVMIDGVDFQMFAITNPVLESRIMYVKYYNGRWKEYPPFYSIVRILE